MLGRNIVEGLLSIRETAALVDTQQIGSTPLTPSPGKYLVRPTARVAITHTSTDGEKEWAKGRAKLEKELGNFNWAAHRKAVIMAHDPQALAMLSTNVPTGLGGVVSDLHTAYAVAQRLFRPRKETAEYPIFTLLYRTLII